MGNNPLSLVDPDGQQYKSPNAQEFSQVRGPIYPSVEEWKQRALNSAGIDNDQWQPSEGFKNNQQLVKNVYAYYTKLFNQNENLMWAGMAKLAGGTVLRGLRTSQHRIDASSIEEQYPSSLGMGGSSFRAAMSAQAGYAKVLQSRFLKMQKSIFVDLAWQHQAYIEGGLPALEQAHQAGADVPIGAWRDIASGKPERVKAGNRALLRREQGTILPRHYDAIQDIADFDIIPSMMSARAKSPIPGGKAFEDVLPEGDITVFQDRWKWIKTDMLPRYKGLPSAYRRKLVNTSLEKLSRQKFFSNDENDKDY
jgi:hypothetical protein